MTEARWAKPSCNPEHLMFRAKAATTPRMKGLGVFVVLARGKMSPNALSYAIPIVRNVSKKEPRAGR
jgi:hypothetical protein